MRRGDQKDQSHENEFYRNEFKCLEKRVQILESLMEVKSCQINKIQETVQKIDGIVNKVDKETQELIRQVQELALQLDERINRHSTQRLVASLMKVNKVQDDKPVSEEVQSLEEELETTASQLNSLANLLEEQAKMEKVVLGKQQKKWEKKINIDLNENKDEEEKMMRKKTSIMEMIGHTRPKQWVLDFQWGWWWRQRLGSTRAG